MKIFNGILHTMEGQVFENGWVEFINGKITGFGHMSDCPSNTPDDFDAVGGYIIPGIIDCHSHIGLQEEVYATEGNDCSEISDPVTPHVRAVDAIFPHDIAFQKSINAGVTAAVVGPGSTNVIGGQMAAIKLYGDNIDDMVIKAPVAMKLALGENPKNYFGIKHNRAPFTRMGTAAILREALLTAKDYCSKKEQGISQPYDMKSEALLPVLDRSLMCHIHAHRSDDILTAIRICHEFNLWYTIVHTTDARDIIPYLAKENIIPIVGPIGPAYKPECYHIGFDTPGILNKAGIEISFTVDHPAIPLQNLAIYTGICVREGLDMEAGLRAITINAAKSGCIDDRTGSIKIGKDADIAVFSGHPFETMSVAKAVYIDGIRRK